MLKLSHHIHIGGVRIPYLLSLHIRSHMDNLSDWAEVRLVAMQRNRPLAWQRHMRVGAPIRISLGYDEDLREEFTGYVQTIANENEQIVLQCQDQSYVWAHARLSDKVFDRVRLRDLLSYMIAPVSASFLGVRIDSALESMLFARFHIEDATPLTALAKLKAQTGLCVYARKGYVYVMPAHKGDADVAGHLVRYSDSRHIQAMHLRTKDATHQSPLQVEVVGLPKGRQSLTGRYGTGQRLRLYRPHISDPSTLKRIAYEEYKKRRFQGYSGAIHAYLLPYCTYGYQAQIRQKNPFGQSPRTYFVEGTHITVNRTQGGQRSVFLGPQMAG